jgi:hypothetical protein
MAGRAAFFPKGQRLHAEGRAEPGSGLLMLDIRALSVRKPLVETTCFDRGQSTEGCDEFTFKKQIHARNSGSGCTFAEWRAANLDLQPQQKRQPGEVHPQYTPGARATASQTNPNPDGSRWLGHDLDQGSMMLLRIA